jgi:hypothetical protein
VGFAPIEVVLYRLHLGVLFQELRIRFSGVESVVVVVKWSLVVKC